MTKELSVGEQRKLSRALARRPKGARAAYDEVMKLAENTSAESLALEIYARVAVARVLSLDAATIEYQLTTQRLKFLMDAGYRAASALGSDALSRWVAAYGKWD